ncbi:MAG: UDP-N-acetylmuramoyl-L-alanine--D-glutamate ligase [bacterium]|nr:UDP-N-acetylmuramoyl-L-alanine--D-glutamate ligase [bacterium]
MLENLIRSLAEKTILILGFGKEGIDTYLALRELFPDKVFSIADKKTLGEFDIRTQKILLKDKNLEVFLGKDYLAKIGEYELIIKTPGISLEKLGFGFAVEARFLRSPKTELQQLGFEKLTSQTEIFFDNFQGIVVGVTGTKGKGTTASLIYEILKTGGFKVFLGGNIGKPVLQYLLKSKPDDIFVYELSSHQLQNLKKSPQIAVFLNLFQDHLDYYKNFKEYQKAKANIAKHQTEDDYLIFNSQDEEVKQVAIKSKAVKIPFSLKTPLTLFERSLKKCYQLKGDFNFLNLRAALKVAEIFKVKPEAIKRAVKSFKGLPHRLEFVGKFKGVEFYDNSMATVPQTTILDLQTFNGKPISLIVGGSDKGSNYKDLAKEISKTSVENLIVLGQGTGQEIIGALKRTRFLRGTKEPSSFEASSMQEAVKICYEETPKNGVCLLSPASASFNLFKDYKDRGEQFKKYVKKT